jgi:hypothetical protein
MVGTVAAGKAPTRDFIIVGVEVSHQQYSGTNPAYYTLVGKFDVAGTGGTIFHHDFMVRGRRDR